MAAKDELGRAGEQRAVRHLESIGYTIIDRNWRCRQGEIDVVARRDREIAIVEVKTRGGLGFGHPFEAIDERQRERLWRLAYAWRADHRVQARGCELRLHAIGIVGPDPDSGVLEHLEDLR